MSPDQRHMASIGAFRVIVACGTKDGWWINSATPVSLSARHLDLQFDVVRAALGGALKGGDTVFEIKGFAD